MRSGPAADHSGYFHEAAFFGSDEQFLELVVPFVDDGLAAGEPVVVAPLDDHTHALVRDAVPLGEVSVLDVGHYDRPAAVVAAMRKLLAGHVRDGAEQIRILGMVPHPGLGTAWGPWAHYEAAVNDLYAAYPLWGVCPYDTRTTPPEVAHEVRLTHPYEIDAAGRHVAVPDYQPPAAFVQSRAVADELADELADAPDVDLVDPLPAEARQALARSAATALAGDELDGLTLAVNEVVTNGFVHGESPVRLRVWSSPDRVVAVVSDRGPGPVDPAVGLVPPGLTAGSGRGLWMAHQMCREISMGRTDDGFTVQIVADRSA